MLLPTGASIGPHAHDGEDELFYIIKGEGLIEDDGALQTVSAGDAPATGTLSNVSGATSSTTLLASSATRKGATIFNDSTALLYVALANVTVSATSYTVQVPAGAYYELPICDGGVYTGIIKGIWASATGTARITELT